MDLKAPRGTRDILPEEAVKRQYLEAAFASLCRRYGYGEIRVPTFEHTELFVRGVGDASDIVRKEMYTFEDKGGRSLTLRPEGTAGVVRAFIEEGMASRPAPVKLFYQMSMFRYEKMQKGRYREFWQFGCEIFGSQAPEADAELIGLLDTYFLELGLQAISLEINSIGCPQCRQAYRQALRDYYEPLLPGMCQDCHVRFELNPLRMLDCKEDHCHSLAGDAPIQLDYLCGDCRQHFDKVKVCLDQLGVTYKINPRMVRGLDYYTRTVFVFISANVGSQGTICGGGRYDELVSELGGVPTAAVGFAMGVERLMLEAESQAITLGEEEKVDLFIASFPSTAGQALALARQLVRQGYRVETDIMGRSLRAQMKAADRMGAAYILVLGEDELAKGQATLRNLSDGSEVSAALDQISDLLRQAGKEEEDE